MSEKELHCSALDNNAAPDIQNHGIASSTFNMRERHNDDSDQDLDEDIMTQSYGDISLEGEIQKYKNSPQKKDGFQNIGMDSAKEPDAPQKVEKSMSSRMLDSRDNSEEDLMTGSYGEISLDQDLINCDKNSDSSSKGEENFDEIQSNDALQKRRPSSLVLAQTILPSKSDDFSSHQVDRSQQTSEGRAASADLSVSLGSEDFAVRSSGQTRMGSEASGLSELQGTLVVEGDMVTFVAEDLQEKIKMSSPVTKWPESSFLGSGSSTPSLYRQVLQPGSHIINSNVLTDLEAQAKKIASCVDTMLENLSGTLQSISSLTVDCMETYENSVCKTCDSVDLNIKAVYQLMAKCEELSNSMVPMYKVAGDVKHIKKMLDQLENIVEHKS